MTAAGRNRGVVGPGTVASLAEIAGVERVRLDAPLAACTTFRVGGSADCLVEVDSVARLAAVVGVARAAGMPVTLLGGGSNTLVSDDGIRGIVVRAHGGRIEGDPAGGVTAEAGVTMNALVRWTIGRGYRGLEAWAGTPGTVGGAIYGNAHFGGRAIGELVSRVSVLDRTGRTLALERGDMGFAYDRSRLQETGEVLLSATFAVEGDADPVALREVARRSLAYRKRTQPLDVPSAGCIFQNPDPRRTPLPPGMPPSAGALIDAAGLKGRAVGGARVSTGHANFIVNDRGATAADIHALICLCRDTVRERFGVPLELEIRLLGFD